jgi:serine/threonine protein kinase
VGFPRLGSMPLPRHVSHSPSRTSTRPRAVLAENPASQLIGRGLDDVHDVTPLPLGARLGDFEVAGIIHRGNAGFVYVGADRTSLIQVAVKEYLPTRLADRMADGNVGVRSLRYQRSFRDGMQRFLRQSRILADFDEPALVQTLRTWQQRGTAYMAMPLYEGRSLKDTFRDSPQPSEAWLKAMLGPLLDALATLHRSGCYPCDVTPQNVVVSDGGPLLFDVGTVRRSLARAAPGATMVLDPGYAAIEQYSCDPSLPEGPWTDIYAVASVLHLAITGKPPPSPVTRADSDDMQPLGTLTRGYSESFLSGVVRGLAVYPQHRPQSIAEFREALGIRPLESVAIPRRQPTPWLSQEAFARMPEQLPAHPQTPKQEAPPATGPVESSPPPKTPEQSSSAPKTPEQSPPLPLQTTTEGRFRRTSRIVGVTLIVVGVAGLGLFWTFGTPEKVSSTADNAASMKVLVTSEQSSPPAATLALAAPTTAPPAPTEKSAASDGLAPARRPANPTTVPTAPAKSGSPAPKAGKIHFAIKPWGEIVVDGKKRGVSPPIKELSVPEGHHRIEIRNGTSSRYADEVDVKAGRKVSIVHSFKSP